MRKIVVSANYSIDIAEYLIKQAAIVAARNGRSISEQFEFWAELGRSIDGLVSEAEVLALQSGLLTLEPRESAYVDPDAVFEEVERRRPMPTTEITRAEIFYQASCTHPGYLEQMHEDGSRIMGRFERDKFVPLRQ